MGGGVDVGRNVSESSFCLQILYRLIFNLIPFNYLIVTLTLTAVYDDFVQ